MLHYWHQVVEKVLETVASPLNSYDKKLEKNYKNYRRINTRTVQFYSDWPVLDILLRTILNHSKKHLTKMRAFVDVRF